ncbi:MAG: hypothetical protein QG623_319, partial [Patescibacteria group bacterium]|nr:hypothetical protein [Patescibacteria group bacterium]
STMTIDTENDSLGRAYLNSLDTSGNMELIVEFNREDFPLDLKFDKYGTLWGLFITPAQDTNDLNFRVAKFKQDFSIPPNPIITPAAPKSGSTAIFMVIASLVLTSSLLFSTFIHKRHIKTTASIK